MKIRRLLAVTHAATITGAPMNLSHFLGWLRRTTDIEVHTVSLEHGPLLGRFEQAGSVTVLDRSKVAKALTLAQLGAGRIGNEPLRRQLERARFGAQLRHLDGFDVVYCNSATSIVVAPFLPPAPLVVSHVHELQVALRTMTPPDLALLTGRPDAWIAASAPVEQMLVGEFGLPAERVRRHDEFIDVGAFDPDRVSLRAIEACRRRHFIPPDGAVVVGSGTLDWRKGPDLFIQLACEVRRRTRRPVHFVWVGGAHEGTDWQRVRSDRERAGADHVHFVTTADDPAPFFAMADVFALTSREDPLPLVCLESAAVGTPIVTYRNGGIPGLLEAAGPDAAAGIADHLDLDSLTDAVLDLLHSHTRRAAAAEQVQQRVRTHHSLEAAAHRLLDDLERLLDDVRATPSQAPERYRTTSTAADAVP